MHETKKGGWNYPWVRRELQVGWGFQSIDFRHKKWQKVRPKVQRLQGRERSMPFVFR